MSRIELEQISENEIQIIIPPETPAEVFEDLKKGLIKRGLVENLSKSTMGVRYFYRPDDSTNQVADKLIKSLKSLAKEDEAYWTPKAQFANQKRVREQEIAARRSKLGIGTTPNTSPSTTPVNTKPKMYDQDPKNQATAGGTGKRYAYIADKSEHDENCECEKCEMAKSNYGPKGAGQYSVADNARRKMKNLSDQVDTGPNVNVKSYSAKPGQLSNKAQADALARKQKALNRKQPVRTMKDMSPEELADLTLRHNKNLKKSVWADHLPFPNAEEEMERVNQSNPVEDGENALANQLANMMKGKSMLNPNHRQPTSEDMIMAGEMMGIGSNPDMVKSQDQQWQGAINNWLQEATKPISQRFASEKEEQEYWDSLKIADRDDGQSGY